MASSLSAPLMPGNIPRIENVFIFRNEKGEILRQYNAVKKYTAADFTAPGKLQGKTSSHRDRKNFSLNSNDFNAVMYDKFDKVNYGDFIFLVKGVNNKYGLIDTLGNLIADAKYDSITYSDSFYYIKKEGKWGLMDAAYTVTIAPTYRELSFFKKNTHYACVEKCGIIDSKERILAPFDYDKIIATPYFYIFLADSRDTARDYTRKKYGIMGLSFQVIILPTYYLVEKEYGADVYYAANRDGWKVLDGNTGMPITDLTYSRKPFRYYSGYYQVEIRKEDKTRQGFLDVIYDDVQDFLGGIAPVQLNGKWGFINTKGKMVIDYKYDEARLFLNAKRNVVAKVRLGSDYFYIDQHGNQLKKVD